MAACLCQGVVNGTGPSKAWAEGTHTHLKPLVRCRCAPHAVARSRPTAMRESRADSARGLRTPKRGK